jgi:hypothetical protein
MLLTIPGVEIHHWGKFPNPDIIVFDDSIGTTL